jgi:ribonucleoside-triphosphate reductase
VTAKKDHFPDLQRAWSNNSLLSYRHPTKEELTTTFELMLGSGGSEPDFVNAQSVLKGALWFQGVNPCAEMFPANKSFSNLIDADPQRRCRMSSSKFAEQSGCTRFPQFSE